MVLVFEGFISLTLCNKKKLGGASTVWSSTLQSPQQGSQKPLLSASFPLFLLLAMLAIPAAVLLLLWRCHYYCSSRLPCTICSQFLSFLHTLSSTWSAPFLCHRAATSHQLSTLYVVHRLWNSYRQLFLDMFPLVNFINFYGFHVTQATLCHICV